MIDRNTELKKKFELLKKKLEKQKYKEVIDECKTILNSNKNDVFFNLLCLSYLHINKIDNAIETMEDAMKLNPKNPDFFNNLGMCYTKIFKYRIAEKIYNDGLKLNQNNLHILNNLGNLMKSIDKVEKAINIYKRILSIQPDAMAVIYNLAGLYNSMGKFDESKHLYLKMLKLKPEFTEADRVISEMTTYDSNNPHFLKMMEKIKNDNLNEHSKIQLHFALAKAFHDQRKFDFAFENYKIANDLSKKLRNYNFKKDERIFSSIKENYKNLNNVKLKKDNRTILFIVGLPRSGTSLTEQILSSHKRVFGGGELPYIENIYYKNFNNKANIDKKTLVKCNEEYLECISNFDKSNKFFTDKAPLNFLYIGFILKFLPNSKFIHMKRNPADVCWSIYKNYFPTKIDFSCCLQDLRKYYKSYSEMIAFWKNNYNERIYDLSYEELVVNPKNEVKKLLDFCGLEWDKNCLRHDKNERVIKTISYNQARKPIYITSVKSYSGYENYLSEIISLN